MKNSLRFSSKSLYIYAFIQSDLHFITFYLGYTFLSVSVPWELNPQPFALLTQCSTTEPQEHLWRQTKFLAK